MALFIVFALLAIVFSAQPFLAAYSIIILYLAYKFFWLKGFPKVIFIGLVFFWLSIAIKIFYADLTGLLYEDLSISPVIVETTFLSLHGMLFFMAGLWLTTFKIHQKFQYSYTENFGYSSNKAILFYLIISGTALFLRGVLFLIPGLTQIFSAFIIMKLGMLFLLIYVLTVNKEKRWIIIAIVTGEVVLSFVSFFSSFKDILITLIVVVTFYPIKFSVGQQIRNAFLGVVTIYALLVWQTIKGDYRFFLNQGTKTQQIKVSASDALNKMWELAKEAQPFNKDKNDVIYATVDRISYIEFFSQAMTKVPVELPHENGTLWRKNILHILLPRILNPDKEAIDDSKMVNTYCVQQVATAEKGVSFSLGFMAESYIDFGKTFMMVPVFFVGALIGLVYSFVLRKSINFIWAYAMITPLWIYVACNGIAGTKILGRVVMYLILFYLIRRFAMPYFDKFLKVKA